MIYIKLSKSENARGSEEKASMLFIDMIKYDRKYSNIKDLAP